MVKHSEVGILGAALSRSPCFSAASEALGLSSRVRRAAPSLQVQSEKIVVASYGPTKTPILTLLSLLSWRGSIRRTVSSARLAATSHSVRWTHGSMSEAYRS